MADGTLVGKTILQLDPLTGLIDRANSYIEIHVVGRGASQKVSLDSLGLRGLSAKEVVQLTHPEVVTDAQFIAFITGPAGVKGADGKDGLNGTNGSDGKDGVKGADGINGTNGKDGINGIDGKDGIIGKDGKDGTNGTDGSSAYQLAQAHGFQGTEAEWLASLIGKAGTNGTDGKSAYQQAVDAGFQGTIEEWLASLKGKDGVIGKDGVDGTNGADGKSAYEAAVTNGFVGTIAEWLLSLVGAKGADGSEGKNAYQVAVANGFAGTESEWLLTLIGSKGDTGADGAKGADGTIGLDGKNGDTGPEGKSAYEVALIDGFVGTQSQWLLSLIGAKGAKGDNAHVGSLAGVVQYVEDLPAVSGYADNDYFIVGTHIYMKANGDWTDLGSFEGPAGKDGSGITVLGELSAVGFLPAVAERNGDAWLIGKSMYVWNGARWQLQGQEGLRGEQGLIGPLGPEGKSAYQVAVANGYSGSEVVWLGSLRGLKGDKGDTAVSFVSDGRVNTSDDLPVTGTEGRGLFVGLTPGQFDFWIWTQSGWLNLGNNVGPAGPKGDKGDTGNQGLTGAAIRPWGEIQSLSQLLAIQGSPGHSYMLNGHMWIWATQAWVDMGSILGPKGDKGDKGDIGQPVNAKGERVAPENLPPAGSSSIGDGYIIADYLWVFGTDGWVRMGQWRGIPGTNGRSGTDGKSAYQSAVAAGFQGSEAAWLASLKGTDGVSFSYIGHFNTTGELPTGNQAGKSATVGSNPTKLYLYGVGGWGDAGDAGAKGDKGDTGAQGTAGKTAFEVAAANGYLGSETQWLMSLKGLAGLSAFQSAVNEGFAGSESEWVISLKGKDGKDGINGLTAYELAVLEGFQGSRPDWVASLTAKGLNFIGDFPNVGALPAGVQSQVATVAGHVYIHDTTQWVDVGPVASGPKGDTGNTGNAGTDGINGINGKSAYELAVQGGFVGDLSAWIASLKGADGSTGPTGKSTYQDAVDRGLFQGTFAEFLAAQKGDTGNSTYADALAKGTIPPGTSFADFLLTLKGVKGDTGMDGPTGSVGPAVRLLGQLATSADLPGVGVIGTGYVIPDQTTPGTFNTYVWIDATTSWLNLGHTVGEKGATGDRGLQGLKGTDGAKGDVGSLWIVLARDPQAIDGRVDDYYLNSASQEYFRKTGSAVWASLGFMGGGNLYKPNSDGKIKGVKDGAWVDLALLNTIPADTTETYQVVNGEWKKFDTYTLKALVATTTVDFSAARVFRIDNTAAATVALTNVPDADHATTVVVKVYGKVGAFSWTLPAGKGTLRWFDGAAPAFVNDVTTIIFTWDGREMTGSVPN